MGGETLEVRREKLEVRSKVCHQRTLESKNHESEVKSWKSEVRLKREGEGMRLTGTVQKRKHIWELTVPAFAGR